ncbi:MAG TPA: alpha-2-macroglobulin family protein [Bacteroidia bacterium]|jgi:uncharacterized protein YfaS (alpha-2-macroglobulin family)|nr:alpha-2-macroglobulin family protein [Bacteroidia bacterium]
MTEQNTDPQPTPSKNNLPKSIVCIVVLVVGLLLWHFRHNTADAEPMFKIGKGTSYEKEWARVDSLNDKGLYRSALDLTNQIYTKAKAEQNNAQIVKALIHRYKFSERFQENSREFAIYDLKNELKTSKFPLTQVLHSMLGDMYWQYYQLHRYQFAQRSQTINFDNDSINTWDLTHLVDQAMKEYRASIVPADSLKRVEETVYADVITDGTADKKLRPTLYDFLAFRAAGFFSSQEADISRPADHFELEDPGYFMSAQKFAWMKLSSTDTLSMKYDALKVYQSLVDFHLNDKNNDALVDADLDRILFIRENGVMPDKDSLYEVALRQLAANYPDSPVTADVYYYLALYHSSLAGGYAAGKDDKYQWENKRAVEICDATIKKFPLTQGGNNCNVLRLQILQKNFSFQNDITTIPDQPSRALLTFKNVNHLWFRIVSVKDEFDESYDYRSQEDIIKDYLKRPLIASWEENIPNDSDYQTHSAEIKIPELKAGAYVILASADKDFSFDKNGIAYNEIWSSMISYIDRQTKEGGYEYFFLDRNTGAPLENADVQVWQQKYDYTDRGYHYRRAEKLTTDKDGMVTVPPTENYRTMFLEANWNGYHLYTNSAYQYKNYYVAPKKNPKTFFFTDRAIYRPGQTIYFKGIMIETDGTNNEILKNTASTVTFYDVNYQKVASLDLTTNDYGSFSGTFTAPSSGLTGQMHMQNESGNFFFSVEEYKRPKFEVNMEPIQGAYRLNDSIRVKGKATMFAGSDVDGATVNYRVVRSASFPYWYYYWRGYYPQSPTVEITNGTVTSNDTGGFSIPFKALPDRTVPSESSPTFSYTVYVDVTDITGETHSTTAYVYVGYVALNLSVGTPSYIDRNEKDSVSFALTNLSGQSDSGVVNYTVTKLNSPDHVLFDRTWSAPDKYIYSEADWNKWFPEYPYKQEGDMTNWKKGTQVLSTSFRTSKNNWYTKWNKSNWEPGSYVVEAHTRDKYGNDVKDVKYFTLYDIKQKTPATKEVFSFQALNTQCQPGEKAKFLFGTAAENIDVLYEIEQDQQILSKEWIVLNNEQRYIEIPIEEKYRGNIAVHFAFVYHNHAYTQDQTIYVPWESKDLDISFETFRDKLQPGSKEEWKLKVKGPKGEKVAAEMVAAMYDASLDEFRANYWSFSIYQSYYNTLYWQHGVEGISNSDLYNGNWNDYAYYEHRSYDRLNWFGYSYYYAYYGYNSYIDDYEGDGVTYAWNAPKADALDEDIPAEHSRAALKKDKNNAEPDATAENSVTATDSNAATGTTTNRLETVAGNDQQAEQTETDFRSGLGGKTASLADVKARENLNETVFFYPQLETDSSGTVTIKFTMNEALTKWKFTAFAHTKDLKYAQVTKEVVTQKDLMIMPVPPRFLREKDHFTFTAKVANLSGKDLDGTAMIQLFDATTMKPVDAQVLTSAATLPFSVKKGLSAPLSWDLYIPVGMGPIQYKVVASAGNFSDGETDAIPVLSNRMLVTETMPLPIRGGETKNFTFEKLLSMSNGSSTLTNQRLTLEFTSNPAWYAVQALPYMMEYPYECAEQTFERYYANSIASTIANSSPKIKAVFDTWKTKTPDAFLSNLEKNQDLKNLILTETPWVLDSKDESERKRRVALLFDMNTMSNELDHALTKLEKMQVSNGGWPWFEDMPDDRYITQYIITGMGHLDHLGVTSVRSDSRCWKMVQNGVNYLDNRIREDYDWILKYDKAHMDEDHLSYEQIQYLYARSYFKDVSMSSKNKTAFDYFMGQAKKYWTSKGNYMEGMIALATFRYDDKTTSDDVMKSLLETALNSDEMGMYWKDNTAGYYWYQAPIETQSLLIEAFKDVKNDKKSVDAMRVWLLKNKQTNDWKTTTATAEACYALLIDGTDWLATESDVSIVVGNQTIDPQKMGLAQEAGTGYFKTSWTADQITPDMGKVSVTKKGPGVSWGAMYWQYFEDLDQITPAVTPLSVSKKLFKVVNTSSGPVITPIDSNTVLKPGDKIKVRVELRNDRDMQYIHMKDMRASGFEPINVISSYHWQDGLGYYESTKDASTDFFFSFLPKGTHVFEYQLNVVNAGDFSNGITEVQCMYAPEFSTHSEGIRVKVSK